MRFSKALAGVALVLAAPSAQALTSTQFSALSLTSNPIYGTTSQAISKFGQVKSSIVNLDGFARGTAAVSALQRVSAAGTALGLDNQAIETASGSYRFGIVGPVPADVPITLRGVAVLDASGGSSIRVFESYGRNGTVASTFGAYTCTAGSLYCGTRSYSEHFELLAGTTTTGGDIGFTSLSVYLTAQNGAAKGFIDPIITIDPSFADASRYHLVFFNGAGNPLSLPEPATWAMMLVGFGAAGSVMRARRQQPAA